MENVMQCTVSISEKMRVLADITFASEEERKNKGKRNHSDDDRKSEKLLNRPDDICQTKTSAKGKTTIKERDISKSKPVLRIDERNIWNKFCDFANKRDNFTGNDVLSYFYLISKTKKFKVKIILNFMTKLGRICFEQTGIDIWEDFKVLPNSAKEMADYLKKAFPNENIAYVM